MHARMTTMRVDPVDVEAAIRRFRESSLPQASKLRGYKGATLLIDRESGTVRVETYWQTRDDVIASDETAKDLRAEFAEGPERGQIVSVETYEVVVDEGEWAMGKAA